jgi:hypothetical protein
MQISARMVPQETGGQPSKVTTTLTRKTAARKWQRLVLFGAGAIAVVVCAQSVVSLWHAVVHPLPLYDPPASVPLFGSAISGYFAFASFVRAARPTAESISIEAWLLVSFARGWSLGVLGLGVAGSVRSFGSGDSLAASLFGLVALAVVLLIFLIPALVAWKLARWVEGESLRPD